MKSTTKLQVPILGFSAVTAIAFYAIFALAPSAFWTSGWGGGTFASMPLISAAAPPPLIENAFVQPEKVRPGDTMLVSANVSDSSGISSVSAEMPHEKGSDILNLSLYSGTAYNGTWQAFWSVRDTELKDYNTTITAFSKSGLNSSIIVGWSDPAAWWNYSWLYRQKITITNAGAQLLNYSVIIIVNQDNAGANYNWSSIGNDTRFTWLNATSGNEQEILFWIESFNGTSKNASVWVSIPNASASSNTDIYMYYGNPGAASASLSWSGIIVMPFNASCPSGWSSFSELTGKFPQGSATPGGTGGASTHTHTYSGTSGEPSSTSSVYTVYDIPGAYSSTTHTHTYSGTTASGSNIPPYYNVTFCYASSMSSTLPANTVGMFNVSSIPSGWSSFTELTGKFPQGSATPGGTGGASTHTQTYSGTTSASASVNYEAGAGGSGGATGGHTHTYSGTTASGSNIPPYYNVTFGITSATTIMPAGAIALFNGTLPPLGWSSFTELTGKFPQGSATPGGTGGASTHTHTYSGTSGEPSATRSDSECCNAAVASTTHTHTYSGTTASGSNIPPYYNVTFAIRNNVTLTSSMESEELQPSNPKWYENATKLSSPAAYNAETAYGFQINWTDANNYFANASFQLGRPSGTLTNYTNSSTIKTQYASGDNYASNARWYINFTQDQLGGAGTYNYTWFGISNTQLQNTSDTWNYTINTAPASVNLFINGTEASQTFYSPNVTNLTASVNVSGLVVRIDANFSGTPQTIASSGWSSDYAGWNYRKPITINGSTSALTDYQVPVNIATALYNNTGLVGSWHFSEGSGNSTTLDSSGFGNTGTLTNMNTTGNATSGWTAGKYGNGLRFDGVNDYVDVGATPAIDSSDFTLMGWVQTSDSTQSKGIITNDNDGNGIISLRVGESGTSNKGAATAQVRRTDGTGLVTLVGTNVSDGLWHQLSMTRNGNTISLYVDGTQTNSGTTQTGDLQESNWRIGSRNSGSHNMIGLIDEVRIYNRSLSTAEIADLYNASKSRLDYQDLRFTYYNGTNAAETAIPFWLENDNYAWAKTNLTAGNNTIYMYYGNPAANTTSSYDNVFIKEYNATGANDTGLVGEWHMDDSNTPGASQTVRDSSGMNNHGTYNGSSLQFDGNDDNVDIPATIVSNASAFTYSLWIKANNAGDTDQFIIGQSDGSTDNNYCYALSYSRNSFNLSINGNNGEPMLFKYPYNLQNWTHVMVSNNFSGNAASLYINGQLVKTDVATYCKQAPVSQFKIGKAPWSGHNFDFNGTLDEVRIYNRSLSAAEAAEQYRGTYSNNTGLVAYWSFKDGSGTSATDSSGMGRTGTLRNGTATCANGNCPTWSAQTPALWQSTDGGQWDGRSDVKFANGSAMNFNGLDDYVNVSQSSSLSVTNFTVSAWFNVKSNNNYRQWIFGHGNVSIPTNGKFDLVLWDENAGNPNKLYGHIYDTAYRGVTGNTVITANQWHYASFTYNGSVLTLYLDGSIYNQTSYSGTFSGASLPSRIGAQIADMIYTINGTIDEVRIYNRSLSANEIYRHYIRSKYANPAANQLSVGAGAEQQFTMTAINFTNLSNLAKGVYNITAYVIDTQNLTGTLSQTWYLTVWGRLNISIDAPASNAVLNRTYPYWLNATVYDDNGIVAGANVSWFVSEVMVNSSNNSYNYNWTVPASQTIGPTTLKANVTKDYYDFAENSTSIQVWRTLATTLNVSPETIYRNNSFSPYISTYTANVTDEVGPVSAVQITFYRGATAVGLNNTLADGTTSRSDNPSDTTAPGVYAVVANITAASVTYSYKMNASANVTIMGLLFSTISSPSNNSKYYKNDTITLQSETVTENPGEGAIAPDTASWIFNGTTILGAETGTYQIAKSQALGYYLLNYTSVKQYYDSSFRNKTIQIWSWSAANSSGPNLVYRGKSANYTGYVYDFINDTIIQDYNCLWLNNATNVLNSSTNSTGYCIYNFTTSCANTAGLYVINISIANNTSLWYDTRQGYDNYSLSLNLTGNLSIAISTPYVSGIYHRGDGIPLTSTITDDCAAEQVANSLWYANDSQIASGKDTTWNVPFAQALGPTAIKTNATQDYFKFGEALRNILVYGWANNTNISGAGFYPAGVTVNVSCKVQDANTSSAIQNYPVNFYKNDSLQLTNYTNSNGVAYWYWNTSQDPAGAYAARCAILDNSSLYYNASISNQTGEVSISRGLGIDQILRNYNAIYRGNSYDPHETIITVHAYEAALGNSSSATISFYNSTSFFDSCVTNATGWCSITYNPSDWITPNNYTFWINATKGGFASSPSNSTWIVVNGVIALFSIESPLDGTKFHKTDAVSFATTEQDENGLSLSLNVNWYNSTDALIASGQNTQWAIPANYTLGQETIKGNTSLLDYYDPASATVAINIYGWSNVSWVSSLGTQRYGDTLALNCSVSDANTSSLISEYNVSFYRNNTFIGSNLTSGGFSVVYWTPAIADYSAKCNITDNATLYYDKSVSQASQSLSVRDLTNPQITKTTILFGFVELGNNQTFRANVTDDVSISSVWVALDVPPQNETDSATYFNITMALAAGNSTVAYYELNYTAEKGGVYNVTIFVNDTSGNENHTLAGNFSSPKNTTGYVSQPQQYMEIADVNSTANRTLSLNVSLVNTGNTSMGSASITLTLPGGWNSANLSLSCGTVVKLTNCTQIFNISISAGAASGNYTIASEGKWRNPDNTLAYGNYTNGNYPTNQTVVNVTGNPMLNITAGSFIGTVGHGNESTIGAFTIQSLGNEPLTQIFYNRTSGNLSADWVEFESAPFVNYLSLLSAGQTKDVNVNVTVPATESGYYAAGFVVNATNTSCTGTNCWKIINISLTIPQDWSWKATPASQGSTVYLNASGNLTNITIENLGNIRINFAVAKSGNASSLIVLSDSYASIENQSSYNMQANYSIPLSQPSGIYLANITISNSSASPAEMSSTITLDLRDTIPPSVNNTNLSNATLEANYHYLNITADAFDNLAISAVWANITLPNASSVAVLMGNFSQNTYRANFTPSAGGVHNVTVFVNDTSGNANSAYAGNFTAFGTASGFNSQYPVSVTASNITQASKYQFVINATLNSAGSGTMRFVNFSLTIPSGFESNASGAQCPNLSAGGSCLNYFAINVTASASPSVPDVTGNFTWQNPDYSIGYASNATSVNVQSNPILNISETNITASVGHGNSSGIGSFMIMSEGNAPLNSVYLSASGNLSGWLSYSSSFPISSIAKGANLTVNVTASVPIGAAPGIYAASIMTNATSSPCSPAANCWDNVTVNVTVPQDWGWSVTPARTPASGDLLVPAQTGGSFVITVNNSGNLELNLTLTQSGNATSDTGGNSLIKTPSPLASTPVRVTKQNYTNVTFAYDSGSGGNPAIIGGNYTLDIKIANSSASPAESHSFAYFFVTDIPPTVGNITVSPATLDQNYQSILIQADAVDNIAVDRVWANITLPDSTYARADMSNPGSGKTYNATYVPAQAGAYSVSIYANDTASPVNYRNNTASYGFTSIGSTPVSVAPNATQVSITGVTQDSGAGVPLNVTFYNLGQGTAYFANLSFGLFAGWSASPSAISYSNITAGASRSNVSTVSIPAGALGQYLINASATWSNPNNTIWANRTVVNITVLSNPQIDVVENTINTTVKHGTSNSTNFTINATGNDALSSVSLACQSGAVCANTTYFSYSFTPSSISSVSAGNSTNVTVSVTAALGTPPGIYVGLINASMNASGNLISDTVQIGVSVPGNSSWDMLQSWSGDTTIGTGASGSVGTLTINNRGNQPLLFTSSTAGNGTFYMNFSQPNITVAGQGSGVFTLNYYSPSTIPDSVFTMYSINVSVGNSSASPAQQSVSADLKVMKFNVRIFYPSSQMNVSAGDTVSMNANATYGGSAITGNITWSAKFNATGCPISSNAVALDAYNNYYWKINCTAPQVADANNYTLYLYGNYTDSAKGISGAVTNDFKANIIVYPDVSKPKFSAIAAPSVTQGNSVTINVSATDNVAVVTAIAQVTYPNSASENYTLSNASANLSATDWIYNFTNTSEAGDYDIRAYARDNEGNWNSSDSWFEVYHNNISFSGTAESASYPMAFNLYRAGKAGALYLISNFSSNASGGYYAQVHNRTYDVEIREYGNAVKMLTVPLTDSADSPIRLKDVAVTKVGSNILRVLAVLNNLSFSSANVTLNYSGSSGYTESALRVFKCANWSYSGDACVSGWGAVGESINGDYTITANTTSFSAFAVSKNSFVCGDGVCDSANGETSANCATDGCSTTTPTVAPTGGTGTGGGSGGGGAPSAPQQPQENLTEKLRQPDMEISSNNLEVTLYPGEYVITSIDVKNNLDTFVKADMTVEGRIWEFVQFENASMTMEPKSMNNVKIKFTASSTTLPGIYTGDIFIKTGNKTQRISTTMKVEERREALMDVKIETLTKEINPGQPVRSQVTLYNMGMTKKIDVTIGYTVKEVYTEKIVAKDSETLAIESSLSFVRTIALPKTIKLGKYTIEAVAYYDNKTATGVGSFDVVETPAAILFLISVFTSWYPYAIVAAIIMAFLIRLLLRRMKERRVKSAKYIFPVDFKKLPKGIKVGKIAETGVDAYLDENKLTTHLLLAGGTGSGKSVSAMVIAEEVLKKGIPVIVFDPTAQWTGFIKPCRDERMIALYPRFGIKPEEAKAFKGTIVDVTDPKMSVDITKYLNKGEITVFNLNKMFSADLDSFVRKTIENIFSVQWKEARELKALIIYDEVHRLLPKYGGKGGYTSLERGAREFRKWGIGLMMISQVLLDFRGAVRAVIASEGQLRTKYEGDINRVKTKYGAEYAATIPKLQVGTVLFQNPEYNDGKPWFISFRPLLHDTSRIPEEELQQYKMFEKKISELEEIVSGLKAKKVETYDLEIELNIAKEKVKQGQMRMAQTYIDSIEARLKKYSTGK